jgi:hypothetical protein
VLPILERQTRGREVRVPPRPSPPRKLAASPWGAQTRPRTESDRFAGRSNKCIPRAARRERIEQKARDHIGAYLETRNRWNAASSLKAFTDAAAREYEDRFLIELIQNGYDTHVPDERHGRIVIRLARDEGPHGTIYVANGGTAFTQSNFNSLCEIARVTGPASQARSSMTIPAW